MVRIHTTTTDYGSPIWIRSSGGRQYKKHIEQQMCGHYNPIKVVSIYYNVYTRFIVYSKLILGQIC